MMAGERKLLGLTTLLMCRSGEYAGYVADLAKCRLFEAGAIQWELRKIHAEYQGKSSSVAFEDRPLFSVCPYVNILG